MPHEVAGDHVHEWFAHGHVRGFAALRVHVQAALDVIKESSTCQCCRYHAAICAGLWAVVSRNVVMTCSSCVRKPGLVRVCFYPVWGGVSSFMGMKGGVGFLGWCFAVVVGYDGDGQHWGMGWNGGEFVVRGFVFFCVIGWTWGCGTGHAWF